MIALLMVGFGCGGYGIRATTEASMLLSTMAGLGGALIMGLVGYALIRMFYTSQASSTVTDQEIIGHEATLLNSVPSDGVGQVSCTVHGREITYMARSSGGKAEPEAHLSRSPTHHQRADPHRSAPGIPERRQASLAIRCDGTSCRSGFLDPGQRLAHVVADGIKIARRH